MSAARPFLWGLWMAAAAPAWAQQPPRAVPVAPPPPPPPVVVPGVEPPSGGPGNVLSATRQFRVGGGTPSLQGGVTMLAEEVKTALLKAAAMKDEWKVPITIRLEGEGSGQIPARAVAFDLFFNEAGWGLELKLHVGRGIDREQFRRGILTALLYEQALRRLPPGERDTPLVVPPWLVSGIEEAIAWQEDRGDRKSYAALARHGGLYKLQDLFTVTEAGYEDLDGGSRAAFRIASGALVMALIEQPQGVEGFKRFLGEAPDFAGEMPALLKRCFPGMNLSETSMAKWWQLKIMDRQVADLTEVLSVEETEKALEEALKLHFRDAEGRFSERALAEGWNALGDLPQGRRLEAVRAAEDSLVRLSFRCFPSYRILLGEYQSVLSEIVKGKTAKTAERLATLAETRRTMNARIKEARDYMDWFEITRARETSGEFEDYLRLKERLRYETPARKEPVSSYLDLMQKTFGR